MTGAAMTERVLQIKFGDRPMASKSGKNKGSAVSPEAKAWAASQVAAGLAARDAGPSLAGKAAAAAQARDAVLAAARLASSVAAPVVAQATPDQLVERQERRRLEGDGFSAAEAKEGAALVHLSLSPARRVSGRDGLVWLNDRGELTGKSGADAARSPTDWMAGSVRFFAALAYRERLEAARMALGSALAPEKVMGAGCGGAATSDRFVAAWAERGRFGMELGACDRALLMAWPKGRELVALRRIAGAGETARSLGKGADSTRAWVAALVRALDLVAVVLRVSGWEVVTLEGRTGRAAAHGRALMRGGPLGQAAPYSVPLLDKG